MILLNDSVEWFFWMFLFRDSFKWFVQIILLNESFKWIFQMTLLKDSVNGFFWMILLNDSVLWFFYMILLKDSFEDSFAYEGKPFTSSDRRTTRPMVWHIHLWRSSCVALPAYKIDFKTRCGKFTFRVSRPCRPQFHQISQSATSKAKACL